VKRLNDCVAVVAGGTGSVGEGVVRSLVGDGATVVVPYRNDAKRQRLEEYIQDVAGDPTDGSGQLVCLPAEIGDIDSMNAFRQELLDRFGRVDLGVACLGSWYYGYSLHNMPVEHWDQVINDNLKTHFICVRTLVSLMHERHQGVYVMINGGAAELIAPEIGAVSISAAAQLMTARVLKQEARGTDIRIHSLMVYNPVKTRDRKTEIVDDWLSAGEVGDYIGGLYVGSVPRTNKTIHRLYTRSSLPQ